MPGIVREIKKNRILKGRKNRIFSLRFPQGINGVPRKSSGRFADCRIFKMFVFNLNDSLELLNCCFLCEIINYRHTLRVQVVFTVSSFVGKPVL